MFSSTNPFGYVASHADAPEGSHYATPGATTNVVTLNVLLGTNVPAGSYNITMRAIDYDYFWDVHYSAGGGTVTNFTSDRDADIRWCSFAKLTAPSSFTNIMVTFSNEVAVVGLKIRFVGLYLTSETNGLMLSTGNWVKLINPSTNDYDATLSGTQIYPDGSFESGGVRRGTGFYSLTRTLGLKDALDNTVAWDGAYSMRIPLTNSELMQIISRPLTCSSNRNYVASFMAKSTGTATAYITMASTFTAPSGYPSTLNSTRSVTISNVWTRVSITNRVLDYPSPEITMTCQLLSSGSTTNWVDALSLIDSYTTNYVPEASIQLGIYPAIQGNIYYSDETIDVPIGVYNSTNTTLSSYIRARAWDTFQNVVADTNITYSLGATSRTNIAFRFPTGKTGHFRVEAYDPNFGGWPDEASIAVIPRQRTMAASIRKFGGHVQDAPWTLNMMTNIGIYKIRRLSPGAYYRWSILEPTEGNYSWQWDGAINLANSYGTLTLANTYQVVPTYAQRTFFRLSSTNGPAFQVGEQVTTGVATGTVALVLVSTNFTGNALMLTNRIGTFIHNSSVTGLVSGATAIVTGTPYNQNLIPNDAPALDKWATFFTNLVTHYQTNTFNWEICNEPNLGNGYITGDAAIYSEMLAPAIRAIRGIQGTNAIITALGGAFATNWAGNVLSNMTAIGLLTNINYISCHLYPGNEGIASSWKKLANDHGVKLVNTETGSRDFGAFSSWGSNKRNEGTPVEAWNAANAFYIGNGYTTASIMRNHIELLGEGVEAVYNYDQRLYAPDDFGNAYTGIEYDDTVKPTLTAIAWASYYLDGTTTLGSSHTSTNISAYTFDRPGEGGVVAIHSKVETNLWTITPPVGFPSYVRRDWFGNPLGTNESSFVVSGYETYLTFSTNASLVATNFASSTVVAAADTEAPVPVITIRPVKYTPLTAQTVPVRFFAIDRRIKPKTGEFLPLALQYSIKLEPIDTDWGPYTPRTYFDMAGYPNANYTLRVRAVDPSGNVGETSETFWLGPVIPDGPRGVANNVDVREFIVTE